MPFTVLSQPLYVLKAELFRSLGHPARIRVLELLAEHDQPVTTLLAETKVEPSSLSQHLAVLKRAGLVTSTRSGNAVTYALADPSVVDFLAAARAVLVSSLSRTRESLESLEGNLG